MTLRAARGELDPVRSRDAEIGRVLEALGKRRKGSCVLVGPPGCGKTALAEAVAMRLLGCNYAVNGLVCLAKIWPYDCTKKC